MGLYAAIDKLGDRDLNRRRARYPLAFGELVELGDMVCVDSHADWRGWADRLFRGGRGGLFHFGTHVFDCVAAPGTCQV